MQEAGTYRRGKGSTLVPVGYSRDNTKLYYRLRRHGTYICQGFYSFVTELFYVDTAGGNFPSEGWELLSRELLKLDYKYAGNADEYFYQQWLEIHSIFNY